MMTLRTYGQATEDIKNAPTWWRGEYFSDEDRAKIHKLIELAGLSPEAQKKKPTAGALLWGKFGRIKTSMAVAIGCAWGRYLSEESEEKFVQFQDFEELAIRVASARRFSSDQSVEETYSELMKPTVLILDDLAKVMGQDRQELASILVNGRINRGLLTIATTNCLLNTDDGIAQFSAGADSRTYERFRPCMFEIQGENRREPKP